MREEKLRRTYQETYFWAMLGCVALTMFSEYSGISVPSMTEYANGLIKKTFDNANTLIIWIVPVAIMIKKEVAAWREGKFEKDIQIAEIQQDQKVLPKKPVERK